MSTVGWYTCIRSHSHEFTDHLLREVLLAVLVAAEEAEGAARRVRAARRSALRQRARPHGPRRQQGHQGHHQQVRRMLSFVLTMFPAGMIYLLSKRWLEEPLKTKTAMVEKRV